MANYGRSFTVTSPYGPTTHHQVSEIRMCEGGAIQVWNTDGKLVITYGPFGYYNVKEIFPTERIA